MKSKYIIRGSTTARNRLPIDTLIYSVDCLGREKRMGPKNGSLPKRTNSLLFHILEIPAIIYWSNMLLSILWTLRMHLCLLKSCCLQRALYESIKPPSTGCSLPKFDFSSIKQKPNQNFGPILLEIQENMV